MASCCTWSLGPRASAKRESFRTSVTTTVRPRRAASVAIGTCFAPRPTGGTPVASHSYETARSSSVAPVQTSARETSSTFASSSTVPRRISSGSRLARARCAMRLRRASRSARASASLTESALWIEPATYWPMIMGTWSLSGTRSSTRSPTRRSAPTRRSRETSGSAANDFAVAIAGNSCTTLRHISAFAALSASTSDWRWSITRVRTIEGSAIVE